MKIYVFEKEKRIIFLNLRPHNAMKSGFAEILESMQSREMSRLLAKVPEWASAGDRLTVPGSLSVEQCSSSATAGAKASLLPAGIRLADLTGGLGVDCAAFSRVCGEVLYNERNPELRQAVENNFRELGIGNVRFSGEDVHSGNLAFVRDFRPDMIFLDPARRAADGRKVFRLQDCSPDVCALLPELYGICPHLMLKLSPMADISLLCRELPGLKEVHILGVGGECKELLCLLERDWEGPVSINTAELRFTAGELAAASVIVDDGIPQPGTLIFEPSAVLSKAGCYGILCERCALRQLGRDVHLFTGENFPSEGKVFRVLDVFPMGNVGVRSASERYPEAEVSARGLKMTSDELRRRLKCRASSRFHIFGIGAAAGKLLLCCETV